MFSGSKVVRKCDPYERVGAMCLENGKPSIVEYYELTPEMAEAKNENGSLQYGFGVILNYLFRGGQAHGYRGEEPSTSCGREEGTLH